MNTNWKENILQKLEIRNQKECEPFVHIYQQYDLVWRRNIRLDNQREVTKHGLFVLEHENNEFINKKDIQSALDNFKHKVEFLQQQLLPVDMPTKDLGTSSSLSRLVLEQKKSLAHQNEELAVAKQELKKYIDTNLDLQTSLEKVKEDYESKIQSLQQKIDQFQSNNSLVDNLRHENNVLTEKLKEEKDRAAKLMNEMNSFIEGLSSFDSFHLYSLTDNKSIPQD